MSINDLEKELNNNKNNYLKYELIKRVLDKKYVIEYNNKKLKYMENDFIDNLINEQHTKQKTKQHTKQHTKENIKKPKEEKKYTRDTMNENIAQRFGSELLIAQSTRDSKKNVLRPFSKNNSTNNNLYSKF